jgi:hypothetical protein
MSTLGLLAEQREMNGCASRASIQFAETLMGLGALTRFYAATNRYLRQSLIKASTYSGASETRMSQKKVLSVLLLPFQSSGRWARKFGSWMALFHILYTLNSFQMGILKCRT